MAIKILNIFITVWVCLVGLSVLLGVIGMFISAPSLLEGWNRITETFSPFNVANALLIVLLMLPAVGASKLKEHLEKKNK